MTKLKGTLLLAAAALGLSIEPAFALSVGTCGVNNYTANGGGGVNLAACVTEADAVGGRAAGYGWTWAFANNNANAWGSLFANTTTGGMTGQSMGFFAGHGDFNGPFLGNSNGYSKDSGGNLVTQCSNYTWSQGSQKWAVGSACEWLYDGITTNSSPNWTTGSLALNRWYKAFNPTSGVPNGTLHSILSARSLTFDTGNAGGAFIDNCLGTANKSSWQGWHDGLYYEQYSGKGTPGIEPAIMSALQSSTSANWANETLSSPWGNPSAYGSIVYSYIYSYQGTPSF